MAWQSPNDALNRTLNVVTFSLARYLSFSRPWVEVNNEQVRDAIRCVADAQRRHVAKIGELIIKRHVHFDSRTFPMAFSALNDLPNESLLTLVIEDEKQNIRAIEAAASALDGDEEALQLTTSVLRDEKEHLRMLHQQLNNEFENSITARN